MIQEFSFKAAKERVYGMKSYANVAEILNKYIWVKQ